MLVITSRTSEKRVRLLAERTRWLRIVPQISRYVELVTYGSRTVVRLSENKFHAAQGSLLFLTTNLYQTVLSNGTTSPGGMHILQNSSCKVCFQKKQMFEGHETRYFQCTLKKRILEVTTW